MLHIILIAIAAIVVLFLIIAAMQPSEFRVTRLAKINAPPEKVFPHVNDLHRWEAWSPWAKMDPACKILTKVQRLEPVRVSPGRAIKKWAKAG